jgi:putative ABC transport system permease protein
VIDVLYMAWRYLRFNWGKTLVLLGSISLILFLPIGLQVLVEHTAETLTERAEETPLLVGNKGSASDLTLAALYFRDPTVDPVSYGLVGEVLSTGLAKAIPLHLRFEASGKRIVGTTVEYFEFRGLQIDRGRFFGTLGECVLGSGAADSLRLAVGDSILSSPAGAFDVGGAYPLKMEVVGNLEPVGTVDDDAVFVDLKTAWVISGLAHGHTDVTQPGAESGVLERTDENVVANASVLSYTEITPENIDTFHFHGNPDLFPVDAVIAVPVDLKSGIMLRGRYEKEGIEEQVLVPLEVVRDLLDTLFSVRNYVLAASLVIGIGTLATAMLVFTLSLRLRRREIETIRKIGGPRERVTSILAAEILAVVTGSVVIAALLSLVVDRFGMSLIRLVLT